MATARSIRLGIPIAAAAILMFPVSGPAKPKVELAPKLEDYHIAKVAILGLANTAGDVEADEMQTLVLAALSGTGYYFLTRAEDFAQDAERTGVGGEHARMLSTWLKKRKTDELILQKVLRATGFDAVIAMEVSRWEEVTIDPLAEGTSDTSVGLLVQMFAADGALLWSAKESVTEHSRPYLPQFNTRGTSSGQAVTTARGAVPDPPEVEEVARKLASSVVATMPDIKQTESAGEGPGDTDAPADSAGSSP